MHNPYQNYGNPEWQDFQDGYEGRPRASGGATDAYRHGREAAAAGPVIDRLMTAANEVAHDMTTAEQWRVLRKAFMRILGPEYAAG